MIEEEEVRPTRAGRLERLVLDPLSVSDLRAYIGELQREIARAEAVIATKEGARGHADSLFRRP